MRDEYVHVLFEELEVELNVVQGWTAVLGCVQRADVLEDVDGVWGE